MRRGRGRRLAGRPGLARDRRRLLSRGLARAARHTEQAGVAARVDWWRVDARTFDAGDRSYDLVTSHYLHAPDGGMVEVTRRLAAAVAPGGLLLVVGHAPSHEFTQLSESHRKAMFLAAELLPVCRTTSSPSSWSSAPARSNGTVGRSRPRTRFCWPAGRSSERPLRPCGAAPVSRSATRAAGRASDGIVRVYGRGRRRSGAPRP